MIWQILLIGLMVQELLVAQTANRNVQRVHTPGKETGRALASARTTKLTRADDLQAALNAAKPGDTIILEAGATWTGNFTLPAKAGEGYITITSSRADELVPAKRVSPADVAGRLAHVNSSNAAPAIKALPGSHHYRFIGIASRAPAGIYTFGIWVFDEGQQTAEQDVPHHFDIDRCYLVGDRIAGGKRGILLNAFHSSVRNSHIADIKSAVQDSQAIAGWNMRDVVIENNFLEASGENFFVSELSKIPGFYPSDIIVRRNYLYKPLTWQTGEDRSPYLLADGTYKRWVVKNSLELKAGKRVTISGNVFENCWKSGQTGFLIVLKPGASATVNGPRTEDILIENNLGINGLGALAVTGSDNSPAGPGLLRRITVRNNAFIRMGGPLGRMIAIARPPANELRFHRNTFHAAADSQFALIFAKADESGQHGLTVTNNIFTHGRSGVKVNGGSFGTAALVAGYPDYVFTGNVMIHSVDRTAKYPTSTKFVTSVVFAADGYTQMAHPGVGVDTAALKMAIAGVID